MFKHIFAGLVLALGANAELEAEAERVEDGLKWNPDYYNEQYANNTVMYAYGVYCPIASVRTWTCKFCREVPRFQLDTVVELDYLQVLTGYDPVYNQIIVSFRGTHNLQDWFYDLDLSQVEYPGVDGGKVHYGFYRAWLKLSEKIMPSITNLMSKYRTKPIVITGHSLGAAISQIASLDIFKAAAWTGFSGYRVVQNFGSPRWCNPPMVAYFKSQVDTHWRVVNVHDAVATVPPQGPSYVHTPHEVWYTSSPQPLEYRICDGSGKDPNCVYAPRLSINDHFWYMGVEEGCDW